MAKCVCIQHNLKIVETGALDSYVTISDRVLIPPQGFSTEPTMDFINSYNTWGRFESKNGLSTFNESNIDDNVTDLFFMRYNPDVPITVEKWLQYVNRYWRIHRVSNFDRDNRFLMLELIERGLSDNEANKA